MVSMDFVAERAPSNPYGPSPMRRPGSIRRTSTIETDWPEGLGRPMRMRGRARDLHTPKDGSSPQVLAEDWTLITCAAGRQIASIETNRLSDAAQQFVGSRGGGHLRGEIARVWPEEHAKATPLHLLLDDFSGASLVAGWGWRSWSAVLGEPAPTPAPSNGDVPASSLPGRGGKMEGVCSGFRPGASSLQIDGTTAMSVLSKTQVPNLAHPSDPLGWHQLTEQTGPAGRRARRTDVWLEDGRVQVDLGFQDSFTQPEGGRIAVHEYYVRATADPVTFELTSIEVDPRVLPFRECPAASRNAQRMVGQRLSGFRLGVVPTLPGTLGCTHLNDVLRSMEDIPGLAAALQAAA
jgi:hypothetical protein